MQSNAGTTSGLRTWKGEALWRDTPAEDRMVHVAPLNEVDFLAQASRTERSEVVFLIRVLGEDLARFKARMEQERARVVMGPPPPLDGGAVDGPTGQPKGVHTQTPLHTS